MTLEIKVYPEVISLDLFEPAYIDGGLNIDTPRQQVSTRHRIQTTRQLRKLERFTTWGRMRANNTKV